MSEAESSQGGRPTDFDPAYVEQAQKLCEQGATDNQLAEEFNVSVRTIQRWKLKHPEFCHSVKLGKEAPDDRVERSLFERANGFEWVEQQAIKIKVGKDEERVEIVEVVRRVPPDPTAMIFWLKNRRPPQWRDKVDHELSGPDGGAIPMQLVELRPVKPEGGQ